MQAKLTNIESAIKISTIVAKLNFALGLRPGSLDSFHCWGSLLLTRCWAKLELGLGVKPGSFGFVSLVGFLAVKPSSHNLPLTCGGGDEFCVSESARSDESRQRLEGFGVVSKDGSGLGKAGSPNIIITVRMLVTEAAMMKYSRASAADIEEIKVERLTNISITAPPNARIPEVEDGDIVALSMR